MSTAGSRGPTLRRIVALARPEISLLALGTVALAVGSAAALLYPQAIRIIIDGALGTGAATLFGPAGPAAVNRAAVAMGVLALVQGIAIAFRARAFGIAGERVVTRLRRDLYRAILDQEVAFFDERRTGELTSRLASDTSVLQSAVSANVSMGLRHLATAVGAVGFLFFTSARLALVMLAYAGGFAALAIASFLLGLCVMGMIPVYLQYATEICYPAPEGTSGGLFTLAGQISVVAVTAMGWSNEVYGSFTPSLLVFAIAMVIGVVLLSIMKESKLIQAAQPA